MKRKAPNSTIEEFFTSSLSKPPVSVEALTKQSKQNLVIVKSAPQKKVVRISIPSLSNVSPPSEDEFESKWDSLSQSVSILFAGNIDQLNFTRLHNDVEFYCRFKSPKVLFDRLIPQINSIIDNFLSSLTQDLDLVSMSRLVTSFESNLINMRKIFLYLDRSYIFANRIEGFLSLSDIFHNLIRKRFLENPDYINLFVAQIKMQINIFRCGQSESNDPLANVLRFMDDLGLYESQIEKQILVQTTEFYSAISQELELSHFLEWLEISQSKERELLEAGVKPSTIELIFKLINQTALVDNQEMLFGPEFSKAIDTRLDDVIQRLYSFFDNDDIRSIFSEHLGKHFSDRADEILSQKKIADLIDEYANAKAYVAAVFPGNSQLLSDVRTAFDHNFSQKSESISKLLALHFNEGKKITPKEIDFFKLNHSKDVFEAVYFIMLTKRIFSWKNVDVKRENELISCFKDIAGIEYTERLQTLIDDVARSQSVEIKKPSFQAIVLSSHNFPNEVTGEEIHFPTSVTENMNQFSEAYQKIQKQFSKIQFHWSANLSTVNTKYGNFSCTMTGTQALIILALQDGCKNIKKIQEYTGINEERISDNLKTMIGEDAGNIVIEEGNEYLINPKPTFRQNNVKFPSTDAVLAQKAKDSMESNVEEVHNNRIKCVIVMKLKAFKLMTLTDLFNKVTKDIPFSFDIKKFTACLSFLEQKSFIEKAGDKSYRYIP